MIKRYHYLIIILDIDEAKTQTEIQIDKIDKIQVDIEMMHTQTIMQILVSFFLVTFHNGHLKILELILFVSLYIYIHVCVRVLI
jgi:Ca2+/Na+ antiporter